MDANQIYQILLNRGFDLKMEGDLLAISPSGKLTTEDRSMIRKNRTSIIARLNSISTFEQARRIASEAEKAHVDLVKYIRQHAPDLFDEHNSGMTAAEVLIAVCTGYEVVLFLRDNELLVQSRGRAWKSLVDALDAHSDEIVTLFKRGGK